MWTHVEGNCRRRYGDTDSSRIQQTFEPGAHDPLFPCFRNQILWKSDAMFTLCVNGTLSGPILRALGLAKLGEAREAITARYSDWCRRNMFEKLLRLLGEPRFADVDFGITKNHISFFDELTAEEIKYAVKSYKETAPVLEYNEPNLSTFKP